MEDLSVHTELPRKSLTSLLISGIHMGVISKPGWLIKCFKFAVWDDSSYFLKAYLLLLYISKIPTLCQHTL
jgi:hypothetical protein